MTALRGVGRDVDDDVRAAAVGGFADGGAHVVAVGEEREVGAELAGEVELGGVAFEAGDDDAAGAGFFRGDDAAEAALAGAEDDDRLAGLEAGHGDGPAEAGADRVEERRDGGIDGLVDLVDVDRGREVEVLAVAAPEAGRVVDAEESVGADAAAGSARRRDERLDADAVALLDAPARGGLVADLGDAADGLVAGDHGVVRGQRALVLLVVGAADAAGLDAEEGVVGADLGQRELAHLEGAGGGLDDGAGCVSTRRH